MNDILTHIPRAALQGNGDLFSLMQCLQLAHALVQCDMIRMNIEYSKLEQSLAYYISTESPL